MLILGCGNDYYGYYWILWARLTSGTTVRIVGELAQFYALSSTLPKGGPNSLIEMFRCNENSDSEESQSDTESESDDDNNNSNYMFMSYDNFDEELYQ